jgi:phage-related minor tail protein
MDDSQKINIDSHFRELMDKFNALSTFAEAKEWSIRAGNGVEQISGIIRALVMEIAQHTQTLERLKYEASKKPLVGRLFGGGSSNEEKELTQQIEKYRQYKLELEKMVAQMQEAIDFTPKSPDEQRVLIKELRQRKKEVLEKKREITAVIRGPRRMDESQQNAQADPGFDPAAAERRKARYTKDAEVSLQETTKTAIERQIAQLDRDILWVEKFNQ